MAKIEKRPNSVIRKEQRTKKKIRRLSEGLMDEIGGSSGTLILIRKTDSGNVYTYVAFDDFIDALDFEFAD